MGLSTHTEFTREATETVLRSVKSEEAIYEPADGGSEENLVVIVDQRLLQGECLGRGIVEHNSAFKIATVSSLDELRRMPNRADVSAVLVASPTNCPTTPFERIWRTSCWNLARYQWLWLQIPTNRLRSLLRLRSASAVMSLRA